MHWAVVVPTSTDDAGDNFGHTPHLLPHYQAVVGAHGYPVEAKDTLIEAETTASFLCLLSYIYTHPPLSPLP